MAITIFLSMIEKVNLKNYNLNFFIKFKAIKSTFMTLKTYHQSKSNQKFDESFLKFKKITLDHVEMLVNTIVNESLKY